MPRTLLSARNGTDFSIPIGNNSDCSWRIGVGGCALALCGFDRSQCCSNSRHAFADRVAIRNLGLPPTIHAAVVLLSAIGIAAGKQTSSACDYDLIRRRASTESHPDDWQFLRGFVLLRNVPPISEHLSAGNSSRDSRLDDGRQRFQTCSCITCEWESDICSFIDADFLALDKAFAEGFTDPSQSRKFD